MMPLHSHLDIVETKQSGQIIINGGPGLSQITKRLNIVESQPRKFYQFTLCPYFEIFSALIRLNTNKLIYGIISYGSNEGLITRINLKRETTYGAYETVGRFDLDSTSPESGRCFGTPFQAGSMLVEIEAYEGRFEFNFNLLVQN